MEAILYLAKILKISAAKGRNFEEFPAYVCICGICLCLMIMLEWQCVSTNYIRNNALVAYRIASAGTGAFFMYKGKLPRSNRASAKKTHSKTFFLRKKFAYIKNK